MKRLEPSAFMQALLGLAIFVSTTVMAFAQSSQPPDDGLDTLFAILVILLILYFIPSYVAFYRKHPNRWLILVINTVFGGTGIGWLGSLVWAFSAAHLSDSGSNGGESGLNLFANDPQQIEVVDAEGGQQTAPLAQNGSANKSSAFHGDTDIVTQLEKLNALKQSSAIDDEEYHSLKAKLIRN